VWYRRLDMNGKVIEERSMLYTYYRDYVRIPFLFQGQYYDEEIKLAYNRFRYYDPNTGNYICQDPIDLQGGMQLYAYIHDSNSWIDPFG
ncbi:MAG: RHS repeat-associated core domain-containing protein, partial [Hoylesella buccalis]